MQSRPELAVLIARIATGWSRVEERVGFLIVQLLRAEAHTGMKMYQALSSSAAQLSVLRAVARDRLDWATQEELEDVLSELKAVRSRRNKIVHGHWDTSDDHPDELVWTDSSDELLGHSEFWAGYNAAESHAAQIGFARSFQHKNPKRLLYDREELADVLGAMSQIANRLMTFYIGIEKLNRPSSNEASAGGA